MDTLQVHLSTVKGTGDMYGQVVTDHGNLYGLLDGIRDSIHMQSLTIDSIAANLNSISENGVGYDDSISVIAIPLIIGLFAFAFPFLFDAATHINSKYASKGITSMFESTLSFKLLKPFSIAVVAYLVLTGVSTLCKNQGWFHFPSAVINWVGVAISGFYATLLLGIISQCFAYNKPHMVLQLIAHRYSEDRKKLSRKKVRYKIKWQIQRCTFWKSNKWKQQKQRVYRIKLSRYDDYYERVHDERLAELAKYSIREHNEQLFWEVLTVVDEITKKEKVAWRDDFIKKGTVGYACPIFKTRFFFQSLTRYYAQINTDKNIEERILWRWLGAFSKALIPVDQELGIIVSAVIHVTESGHMGFFERYVSQSARSYSFIPHLPDVAFVIGGDVDCQHQTWEKMRKLWRDVRGLHYLMAAYLFSKRHFSVVKSLMADRSIPFKRLYPIEATDVLLLYVRCKAVNYIGCDYGVWRGDDIFGSDPDKDMLEKYTAAMLLLCGEVVEPAFASEKELDDIKKQRSVLLSYANWLKNDSELTNLYPKVKTSNFDQIYDSCIHIYEETKKLGYLEGGNSVVSLGWWQKTKLFLCDLIKCNKEKTDSAEATDIFLAKIDEEHLEHFIYQIRCVFYNKGWMYCELIEPDLTNMHKIGGLGTYSALINKGYVNSFCIDEDGSHLFHTIHKIYEERSCYLMCSAFKEMDEIIVRANHNTIEDTVKQILGKDAENYVLVDFDSHCYMFMNVDYKHNKCLGADYKRVYVDMNDHLSDTELIGEFKGRMVIVRREDMPILAEDVRDSDADVIVEDISKKDEGLAALKVNITPGYTMWYSKASYYMIDMER